MGDTGTTAATSPADSTDPTGWRRQAIVVGAGIGGLTVAIALARTGWAVTVIERDDTPMPDDIEGAFDWDRRGAPQVRHTHGFPALIRVVLRDRFPDVLDALRAAGVGEVGIMPASVPADSPTHDQDADDLTVLSCRRTTLEWVLRTCALAEHGVRFRVGAGVRGLLADVTSSDRSTPLTVRGVRLDDDTDLDADVVVAATGRRDAVPSWLAQHGVEVTEEEHPTGTIYLSRFYRSADGVDPGIGYQGGRRAGLGFVVAGADNGTYSATLAVPADDDELRRHLLDAERFEAVLPLFREMAPVVTNGGTPVTDVQAMGGLVNRIRRFVTADGSPLAHGFFAIGDAHTCTNPLYGRGSSLAVLQATMVADALAAHPDDPAAAARSYELASAERVEPWYDVSVLTDRPPAPAETDGGGSGSGAPSGRPKLDLGTLRRIMAAGDPELSVKVTKFMTLLLTPAELFGDPAMLDRIVAAAAEVPSSNGGAGPELSRADLLAAGRP